MLWAVEGVVVAVMGCHGAEADPWGFLLGPEPHGAPLVYGKRLRGGKLRGGERRRSRREVSSARGGVMRHWGVAPEEAVFGWCRPWGKWRDEHLKSIRGKKNQFCFGGTF